MKHETDNSCQPSAKVNNALEYHIHDHGRCLGTGTHLPSLTNQPPPSCVISSHAQ
jgi:hypothetical protein